MLNTGIVEEEVCATNSRYDVGLTRNAVLCTCQQQTLRIHRKRSKESLRSRLPALSHSATAVTYPLDKPEAAD